MEGQPVSLFEDGLRALLEPTPGARRPPTPTARPLGDHSPSAELDDFDGARGEITARGDVPVHDWQEVLKIALPSGFDAKDYVLVGNPRVTSHTRIDEETGAWVNVQAWWKITFARVDVLEEEARDEDGERLHDQLIKWKLPARRTALQGDHPFVINLADLQIGQLDDGGTAHTLWRLKQVFAGIRDRVEFLRSAKLPLGTAVVAGLGDLVEGCSGFYAMQAFTVDLDRRDQTKVVRRLIVELLKMLVELGFEEITVVAAPGNHGENRDKDGKANTTFNDNDDVAVFEAVYDIIRETTHADRFLWRIPTDELVVTAQVADRVLGWSHGHQPKGGGTPQSRLLKWWTDQSFGLTSVLRDVDLLTTAHYHHFSAIEYPRVHLQTPAMCGTSLWWKATSGQDSIPGVLTYVVTPGEERPFTHLEIITPPPLPA